MKKTLLLMTSFLIAACSQNLSTKNAITDATANNLYSSKGIETQVSFSALYQSSYQDLESFQEDPTIVSTWEVSRTVKFLFGPLVHRAMGGPQRDEQITLHPEKAFLQNGYVMVPYDYQGLWLLDKAFPKQDAVMPLPYQQRMRITPNWVACGDSAPEHQDEGFFWYFWDPARYGCDQVLGVHYQNVTLKFGNETKQSKKSYPEYRRMIQTINGEQVLQMTFAFGYVEDREDPKPFRDYDAGMQEFQRFVRRAKKILAPLDFEKTDILQSEYGGSEDLEIGARFTGMKNGVKVVVSIVAAAGVDQMMLFAESYASRKEPFFGWFGHSRVGSGFDAQTFQSIVASEPERFALVSDYQLIYWAGCNSYSYYTLPFFDMKAQMNPSEDPNGTKNLDIISNGLPSYFSLNAINAEVLLKAILNWEAPTSYQDIVNELENRAYTDTATLVLVNVLGDEDNP